MKKTLLSILLSSACVTIALAQNIATVNGVPIPVDREKMLIEQVQQMNPGTTLKQEDIDRLRDNLISQEVLYQEAVKQGLDKTPLFNEQLELMRRSVLIKALHDEYTKKNAVDDKAIEAEYNKIIEASNTEYLIRHILVEKESDAKDLITQINKGADFAALAGKHSTDTVSAKEGGSLDWITLETLVPEFSQAVTLLKKGEITSAPVKSSYGWHIIKLEDTRKPTKEDFPPLDDNMKAQLKHYLEERLFSDYQKKLFDAADIKINKE